MTTRSASSVPPLFSVAFLPSMPATVSSRWKTTPCSSCRARTKSPIPGPRMRSIGRFSGATTWTSMPRWRSEAATSSPMKLAPITRARLADLACSMIARLSARLRSVWTCDGRRAGNGQAHRLRAGRQQQPVVGDLAAVRQHHFVRARIDARDIGLEAQVDAVVRVEVVAAQRDPFLGRVAGEIILGEVRTIDRRGIVVAQHDDAALVLLAPQHLGRREAGRAAAHDHDLVRRLAAQLGRGLRRRRPLLLDEDLAVALLDRPAVDRR